MLFSLSFSDISLNDLLLQIKTLQLNMYAEDAHGQLHTSNTYLVSLDGIFFFIINLCFIFYFFINFERNYVFFFVMMFFRS